MSTEPDRRPDSGKVRRDLYVDEEAFDSIKDPRERQRAIDAEVKRLSDAPDHPRVWHRRNGVAYSEWFKRDPRFAYDTRLVESTLVLVRLGPSWWVETPKASREEES